MSRQISALVESAAARSQDARRRVLAAVRSLERRGEPVSLAALAKAAGVSRTFIYDSSELRALVDAARQREARPSSAPVAARERSSLASLKARIDNIMSDNRRLREELASANEDNARLRGALRRQRPGRSEEEARS